MRMQVEEAHALVEDVRFIPGWTITPHKSRFQGVMQLVVTYPARDSDEDKARQGYPEEIQVHVTTHVRVDDISGGHREQVTELARRLHAKLVGMASHEYREFLRFESLDFWSPLHPHRRDGIDTFGDETGDLMFGVA